MNWLYVFAFFNAFGIYKTYMDDVDFLTTKKQRVIAIIVLVIGMILSVHFGTYPVALGTYNKETVEFRNNETIKIVKELKCKKLLFVEDPCEVVYQVTTHYMLKEASKVVDIDNRSK